MDSASDTFSISSLELLDDAASWLLDHVGSSHVLAFDAEMGAGKTTLIAAVLRRMGSDSVVNSPTFAIVNEYDIPAGCKVYHADLYRIKNERELFDMGFEEYINSRDWLFVEWPEMADSVLPDDTVRVSISVLPDGSRSLSLSPYFIL